MAHLKQNISRSLLWFFFKKFFNKKIKSKNKAKLQLGFICFRLLSVRFYFAFGLLLVRFRVQNFIL